MPRILKAKTPVLPDGDVTKDVWQQAEPFRLEHFPWYAGGEKQATQARLAYDERSLYLLFECEDAHISAAVTELNGPVCTDSCVEFFATYDPATGPDYFNIEVNCCGTLLVGHGPAREPRTAITPELAGRIKVYHSVPGPVKDESPDDDGWVIEMAVPWAVLGTFAGVKVPGAGTEWKVNLYRIGGKTDPQYGTWADITWKEPDFHRPEFFGPVTFG